LAGELLLGGDLRGLRGGQRVTRVLQLFARHRAGGGEPLAAAQVLGRTGDVGVAHLERGPQLRRGGEQAAHFAHRLAELRLGLIERDARVGRIELDERLARLDELRVVRGDADHGARDLRRDLHDVAVDVRVVGGLFVAQRDRPVRAVARADQRKGADRDGEPARAPGARGRGGGSGS
jgi:hypothetical protein